MIPKIPDITLVLTFNNTIKEEFNTFNELIEFVLSNKATESVAKAIHEEWADQENKSIILDDSAFQDYCFDNVESFLNDYDFTIERVPTVKTQEQLHAEGEACDELECQDCCGEFVGHELDDSEGGMCINCGYHPNW